MITLPGLYPSLSPADYFAGQTPTPALTSTGIKILTLETPYDFHNRVDTDSAAKRKGDVAHQLALGKGTGYAVSPWDDYRTNLSKEWRDDMIAIGRTPIKQKDFDDADNIATLIQARLRQILGDEPFMTEVPFYWRDWPPIHEWTSPVWCSGMLDVWCPTLAVAIDIKITPYLAGDKARAHIANMGWHWQNAWYRRGLGKIDPNLQGKMRFLNLLIKPDEPYTSRAIEISEGWRSGAEMDCLRALALFAECQRTDIWPGYPDHEVVDEPTWLMSARMDREISDRMNNDEEA